MHLGRWQDKGTPKLSLLSLMYFGVGVGLMLLGLSLADLQAFLIFLPLGLISLVLGYWCYLNEEDINVEKEKKTSLGLDFERVIQLFKEIKAGNYSNLYGTKYNKDVSDAALQAASEEQIAGIANLINLGSKLELEVENPKRVNEVIMDKLRDAYIELEKDSKYTLIPLFLNEEAKETSPYFFELEIQNLAKGSFKKLLEEDNLTFASVKDSYFENTPWAVKYPNMHAEIKKFIKTR